jgi:hypothetical protein
MSPSINVQREFWIALGARTELNPKLSFQALVRTIPNTEIHSIEYLIDA